MSKYNWPEIKKQIELGRHSLKEIAEMYCPDDTTLQSAYDYIRKKKQREGWEVDPSMHKKFTETVAKKVVEDEAEREAELRKEYEKIITNIRRGAYNCLFNERDFERLKQFKIASQIMRNCRQEQWEVNQIKETAQKIEQEISGPGGGAIEIQESAKEKVKGAIDRISAREGKE